jgi:tetratricopeptide (TPR) repeat protein
MQAFRLNQVEKSLAIFDSIVDADPSLRPYLWQRGLSLYYAERYKEGAKQFRDDVDVNANDTEEALWAFLCEAQYMGFDQSRERFLRVGEDPRPVMRAVYRCYRDGVDPAEDVLAAAKDERQRFYALLYAGLWHEARGNSEQARKYMVQAAQSVYAMQSDDYMAAVARVHCQRRGWSTV